MVTTTVEGRERFGVTVRYPREVRGRPQQIEREVLVTTMDAKYLERYLSMARTLREAGINTEVYLETAKLGNQLTYADRKGFRIAIIAGENEIAKDVVQMKHVSSKTARDVPMNDIVNAAKEILG